MRALVVGAVLAALSGAGCGGVEPPLRDCFARVWIAPGAPSEIRVIGSWNDWSPPLVPVEQADGWRLLRVALPPGEHGYLLSDGTGTNLDPRNPLTTWRSDGQEVSFLEVPSCDDPGLIVDRVEVTDGAIEVEATFLASHSKEPFDPAQIVAETRDGVVASVVAAEPETGKVIVRASGLAPGKVSLGLKIGDAEGGQVETLTSGWTRSATGPAGQRDPRDEILYQAMIDRFRGDGAAPLAPPPNPGARAGGTLDGLTSSLEALEALGATTLWLSPVYVNPVEPQLGNLDGRLYEGYHGYWPVESRGVDERIGGEAAFDTLIAGAHSRGMAVLLDAVPNHVFESNPRFIDNPSWFGDPGCVCGTPSCPWGENIMSCWFTPYLPDVSWDNPEAMAITLDDAEWWMRRFDLDGYRLDAVPMMPRATTRRIADRLRRRMHPRQASFLLGEVFTGPGIGALEILRYHVAPSGLDTLFDFPLMWALQQVIGAGEGSFAGVEAILEAEEQLFIEDEVLARILDNHDTVRFLSVAEGDAFGDPWDEPAQQPTEDEPYIRLMLGQAVVFTLPGIPVVYMGDEVGVAGGGDPDNRRVMPAEEELLPIQLQLRDTVTRLARVRRCSEALRRGARSSLLVAPTRYAYRREGEHPVSLVVSTDSATSDFTLPALGFEPGTWVDAVTGETFEATGDPLPLTMAPLSFRLLMQSDDPCLATW